MKSENINEIQKEDKGAFKKFIVILIIATLGGGILGFFSNYIEGNLADALANFLQTVLVSFSPYANICLIIVVFLPIIYLYNKSRKQYKIWDGENEAQLESIEINLSYALWLTSMATIISFFFFAMGFWSIAGLEYSVSGMYLLLWLGGFILITVCTTLAQQKLVNFTKEINPEKQGSVFDHKFAKKWEESCDEAEKLSIYKSAYKAYRSVNITCMVLWVVCVLGNGVLDFGLLPVAVISIIWGVLTTSYCMECIRLEKNRKK